MTYKKDSLILYLLLKALRGIFDVCSWETHLGRSLGNLPHLVCPDCSGNEVSTPPCVSSDRYWVISGVTVRAGSFLGLRVMGLPFGMWTVPGEGGQTAELRVPSFSVSTPECPTIEVFRELGSRIQWLCDSGSQGPQTLTPAGE